MGHERSGVLPRTKRWREIVEHLASTDVSSDAVLDLATETLSNVRDRFDKIHQDRGVQAAFGFLVSLATQAEPAKHGITGVDTGVSESTSTLQLVRTLKQWVRENSDSLEYSSLAAKAATDAITGWANAQLEQPNLFASRGDIREVWDRASNGAGFCQVARMFFASFTEHYLNYFLDREASANVSGVAERDRIGRHLSHHVDAVSRHAFETSRITQSFAAGWFNKHARDERPSDTEVQGFLAVAFAKMREELLRESEG